MISTMVSRLGWARLPALLAIGLATVLPAWGVHPCAKCHPKEVAGYAASQMGHSLRSPSPEPSGRFTHAVSKTEFSAKWDGSMELLRLRRGGLTAEYEAAYAIGSGTHAVGYLIDLQSHLFQAPICYYPGRGWDMAPGYENSQDPEFYRPVSPDCLVCHAGSVRPVAGTLNTYQTPPFAAEAITCERCHGPSEAHLHDPSPGSIINPAKLPPRARDSICEQCHLSGEARIPNPGKQLSDFRPGENLEGVFSVYVPADSLNPSLPRALHVISQAQQLALSTCARQSHGKLWCGTCHDPHQQPADPKTYFRFRCLSCHGTALLSTHPKPNDDCVGCHMPRRPVSDGAHTVFTDHRIARRPPPQAEPPGPEPLEALVAWHDPPPDDVQRDLGLAEIEVGERIKSVPLISDGAKSLMACWSKFPQDPRVLTAIGQVLLGTGDSLEAAQLFERVIQIEPNVASDYLHEALAWKAARNEPKAVAYLEKTLERDPLLEEAYRQLVEIYATAHDTEMERRTYERYLKTFPGNTAAEQEMRHAAPEDR